ncbi:MAG: endonuclease domain-containing protein [Dehalococcoidales bacterium]|nr:endonuclease domain-containing protein [Dehalococcoidales bacterium]
MGKLVQTKFAKGLRHKQTEAERVLWKHLRNAQLNGAKFRRQEPIGNYIVDFVAFKDKLIIEIDGGQHNTWPVIAQDNLRSEWLQKEGFRVLRFWNNDVLQNTDGVLSVIINALKQSPLPIVGED